MSKVDYRNKVFPFLVQSNLIAETKVSRAKYSKIVTLDDSPFFGIWTCVGALLPLISPEP